MGSIMSSSCSALALEWEHKTARDLLEVVEKNILEGSCGESNHHLPASEQKRKVEDLFWTCMETKLNRGGGTVDSSLLMRILQLQKVATTKDYQPSQPPHSIFSELFVRCNDPHDLKSIILKYPKAIHVTVGHSGELPLHLIARRGSRFKDIFEYILFEGIKEQVGGMEEGFGGLTVKNKIGQTPLSLLFANVVARDHKQWDWLCSSVIKPVVEKIWDARISDEADNSTAKNNKYTFHQIPLLHSALELGAPQGLINRILLESPGDVVKTCDSLGRTPLLIAVSQKSTSDDIIINLIHRHPLASGQKDKKGNIPLNLVIKAGRKTRTVEYRNNHNNNSENDSNNNDNRLSINNNDQKDIFLIGSIVQASPEAMQIQDVDSMLPPFMLASVDDKWPLNVVYGLLRTSPWVIQCFSNSNQP